VVVNAGPLMGADDLRALIAIDSPRVVVGLDLQSPVLQHACKGSTVEQCVWVTLQRYQNVLKRLGYQFKSWHEHEMPRPKRHITLNDLMERSPARASHHRSDPKHTAVLQPTGGTTGTLKVAQISHRNLL
jgi:acyl-CoA synthetase (AMP-forming)/AMP-acid ligase II